MQREGKSKIVTSVDSGRYFYLSFKDDLTAGNGEKKSSESGKGVICNHISGFIFKRLSSIGIPNHFRSLVAPNKQSVNKLEMIPIEVVIRNYAKGGICKRYGLRDGMPFTLPLCEYFLKNDKLNDPLITEDYIINQEIATISELQTMRRYSFRINDFLSGLFMGANIGLLDFKLEFGRDQFGEIILGDEITPDSCRLLDLVTGNSLDKDLFRLGLGPVLPAYKEVADRLGVDYGEIED